MVNSTIQLYLADNTLREVIGLEYPAEVWAKLEIGCKSKYVINRLFLKKQLCSLELVERAHLEAHLDEFNRISIELLTLDVKIKEENEALLLLASLYVSYDHFVTTLLFGKDTLRHAEVIATLLLNESQRELQ